MFRSPFLPAPLVLAATMALVFPALVSPLQAETPYEALITRDQPTFWWSFSGTKFEEVLPPLRAPEGMTLQGRKEGKVTIAVEGPRAPDYADLGAENRAIEFKGDGSSLRFTDPGDNSPLDFAQGDAITLEAWVNPTKLGDGQQVYVVGKGRTKNPGFAAENQNYALRLTGSGGKACVSFLFRDAEPGEKSSDDFHRWNTADGFPVDSGWHHVAVSYVFGQPESIAGYIDGEPLSGRWDYGGPTTQPPVVDNDELWIGSSLGGNPGSTFQGAIDEVAIHRQVIPADRLKARYRFTQPPSYQTPEELPTGKVLVEVFHGIPNKFTWNFSVPTPYERFEWPGFVMTELPPTYTSHGVRGDRSNPVMIRMSGWSTWPKGEITLRMRARAAARLFIDGQSVADLAFTNKRGNDGHGEMYPNPDVTPEALHPLATGDQEVTATFVATGQPQRIQWDLVCGGNKRRPETGEAVLTWKAPDANAIEQVLFYGEPVAFNNAGWWELDAWLRGFQASFNQQRRAVASTEWTRYWERRHERARDVLKKHSPIAIPELPAGMTAANPIDHFIAVKLAEAKVTPQPIINDWAFLRRASLDLIGTIPTADMARAYFNDPPATRRALLIDRLLAHPGWADNWVGYWQDVLAENPNLINPTLNNTGPFRWWIHESFADNKPFDRFATELILMEGSTHYGGPAGFSIASQNDAPMAAKAHILAQAFLGMEMKCARCHDAPYHDFAQKDLFSLASMLHRGPLSVPASSTIPGDPAALQSLLVKVTLKPGEPVPPQWPFAERFSGELATDMLLNPEDRREQLAALITSPTLDRFSEVIANRLWRRYLGRGLMEPVDDWENFTPSHAELLSYLAYQLVDSGYDLKQLARLIVSSETYQRASNPVAATDERQARLFAGPAPRRMSAEQLVDSLAVVADKPLNIEPMNIDVDGLRPYESSLNLGSVERAWQLTSMSNERDRPSLALPGAQTVVDVLETFGWRSTRPDPLTIRAQETTVLQPAILANGVLARRTTQFTDDSLFTRLALEDHTLDDFITQLSRQILSRDPLANELSACRALLSPGYETRITSRDAAPRMAPRLTSIGVSWTNHLHPEANERKVTLKQQLDRGEPATERLQADWRERAEDVVWALLNSPEFVFIP